MLYPINQFGAHGTGVPSTSYRQHWNGSAAAAAWQAEVVEIVTTFKDHPALLAWYICDDCGVINVNLEDVALQARLYNIVKAIDPYHVTAGAVFSNQSFICLLYFSFSS